MSTRYLGGLIRKTPLELNPALGNAANGVFTMSQYLQAVKAATWPGFDPYFKQTVLSLHGNGTNGAQNNTFLDGSTNNFTITRNGNTTQGTFSPFSLAPGQWSNYFDGNGDYLSIARNSAFLPGASTDFTIEAWVYVPSVGAEGANIIAMGEYGDRNNTDWVFTIDTGRTISFYLAATNVARTTTATINLNSWNHVAVSRTGTGSNNLSIYVNGVGQNFTETGAFTYQGTSSVSIGADVNGNEAMLNGYISNLRMINGTGIYSGASITVPTAPLTAISNTILLTCQSNRFVDNSTNAFAITRNGDVRVTPFSPFAPSAAYSPSVNGGSGYFDGTGDYLTVPDNAALDFGTGDFTIECWFYITANAAQDETPQRNGALTASLAGVPVNGFVFLVVGSSTTTGTGLKFRNYVSGSFYDLDYVGTIPQGDWNYAVVSRVGTTTKIFLNGAEVASGTLGNQNVNTATDLKIGALAFGTFPWAFPGYIASVRVRKGVGATSFSVPTAPLTAISDTSLLCNFTNAGIFDNTGKNNLETVGNAQIDTGTKKYGTGSLDFAANDGTSYLLLPASNNTALGGDFTVEFWLNPDTVTTSYATTSLATLLDADAAAGAATTDWWAIHQVNNTLKFAANNADRLNSDAEITASTWQHCALVRSGSTLTWYINGVAEGSSTYSAAVTGSRQLYIAKQSGQSRFYKGFIDDLRITKGVARYTANFTPQTSQWQDQ